MSRAWRARRWGAVALASIIPAIASAAGITGVSPQGAVRQVQQVVVSFSEPVVTLGDLRQADPMRVVCQGAAVAGKGRWLDDRRWAWDFAQELPPGTACSVEAHRGWKPLVGELTGSASFRFSTGGPAVTSVQPWPGSQIEEDQAFILQLNGPALEADVLRRSWCEIEGLAEQVPVRLLPAAERQALLAARRLQAQAARTLVVACSRPLPPKARLRLVWGPGIGAQQAPTAVSIGEQRFDFRVRESFAAEFSCERERAQAPCLPMRPLRLRFSAPVARALAEAVRLHPAAGGTPRAPSFDPDDRSGEVSELRFDGPHAERAAFTFVLPAALRDTSGRALVNAGSFPLKVATGDAPPIAKFSAAPFGVIEWKADPALPITLRHVQGDLQPGASGGQVRVLTPRSDAEVQRWHRQLQQYHEAQLPARKLGLPQDQWHQIVEETDERGRKVKRRQERFVGTREVPLLESGPGVKRLDLPALQGGDPRPFEVVGLPLPEPGYHVVEVVSRRLGQSLLDKPAPMYVRTGVLVTNLGVHFKQGRESSAVWVTTLDRAKPVAGAEIAVLDCQGQQLWAGRTDAQGLARIAQRLEGAQRCDGDASLFVSARKADERGVVDMAFVFSGWTRGIEPWRFNVPVGHGNQPEMRAHTVFDRTLLRAGETLSMKHFLRRETGTGLAAPDAAELPAGAQIVHEGSGQRFAVPLQWQGTRSATSSWHIPPAARLGLYRVELESPAVGQRPARRWSAGEFRVEEFRLPLIDARLLLPRSMPVAPAELSLPVQLNHLNGGAVAQAPLRASALLREADPTLPGWEGYNFAPPRQAGERQQDEEDAPADQGRIVADKLALVTDREGAATFRIEQLPRTGRAADLVAEVSYQDPNGETQTISRTLRLWPAAVVPAIRAASWASARGRVQFTALALDLSGQPIKGQALEVVGRVHRVLSTRKRLVGGFYAYDNRTETQDLGTLCSGRSDERGLLLCQATLQQAGEVELVVQANDAAGHRAQAATSVWITGQGELWFEQDNDDRIDVLPEKRRYEPGEAARLQVRMPYREATALVAVEREGVIDTRVITLRGDDPSFELKIDKAWAPNVYVSVLALRGRVREVPWSSFFDWGWKSPLEWARAFWYEGREWAAPTAMVDLAKPSFKLGVAALQVGSAAHELQVAVQPAQAQLPPRGRTQVKLRVTQGGQPVPGAEIAFAAVDEGLLALRDNDSWQLLQGLLQTRDWSVQTATAHGEIIGRRHYGRKTLPAGGGGGRGHTRELFDTLLLWQPRVALDARGEATLELPVNDSLTAFRLVAVADAGVQQFGTGTATVRVTQDLQLIAGLPPLVRDGDHFSALLTVRNATPREMKLRVTLQGTANGGPAGEIRRTPITLPPQELVLAAGAAKELQWPVDVPADIDSIGWEAAADEQAGKGARDRLKLTQLVAAAVPLRVTQATLRQIDGRVTLPAAAPADALAAHGVRRGGLDIGLQPRLSGALPGLRRYFETYPFSCLEQKFSKGLGLRDAALWAQLAAELPTYLDADGLAAYFPPRPEDAARGSDRLTAYLLQAAHEAAWELPQAVRERMLDGLAAFVEGRIERRSWSPQPDIDVRKIAALEALARHGRAQPRMLGSIQLQPQQWPSAAVIDWLRLLQRMPDLPDRARRLDEAQQILRTRLSYSGTTLKFSTEDSDFWWWLMDSADANAAKLILAVLEDPAWRDELPRLVAGSLARQNRGAWLTTTANLWGSLALEKFSTRFESTRVDGRTRAELGAATRTHDWSAAADGARLHLPWPAGPGTLAVVHEGSGRPWLSLQALAAVPLAAPLRAGYTVQRSVSAVEQKDKARLSRGDVLRVRLEVDAQADMTWVVVSDPVPAGATVLGSGLGRDSLIATRGERREGSAWPSFEERSFEAFRGYYEFMPRGRHVLEYTVRLNNPGRFALPPTRVEAMYAPERFGEAPNAPIEVAP